MAMDLILRGANLADGRREQDIGIEGGRIVAVEPRLAATAGREIDVSGYLVSAPFVDAHFHMDATLSLGLPRLNRSGTLLEGIALWGELKPLLTVDAVIDRALAYCDWAVAKGLLAIRSHVDICDPRLLAVEALLEVKRRVKPYLDLQLVAFPQDGYFRFPGPSPCSIAPLILASMSLAAFRILNAQWPMVVLRYVLCARSRQGAA
jgi:cytosine deaminase